MNSLTHFLRKYRIDITRILIVGIILLDMFSTTVWQIQPVAVVALETAAFLLILVATFGRLWTLSYISGNKSYNLVQTGPYSLMRNPLYYFSLCGALGLGIASKSIIISGLIILPFAIYYPIVIRAEERHLEAIHAGDFQQYKASVPVFFPRFSRYDEPETYQVDARRMRRAFFSVMWFPIIYFYMITLDRLQASRILYPAFLIR